MYHAYLLSRKSPKCLMNQPPLTFRLTPMSQNCPKYHEYSKFHLFLEFPMYHLYRKSQSCPLLLKSHLNQNCQNFHLFRVWMKSHSYPVYQTCH